MSTLCVKLYKFGIFASRMEENLTKLQERVFQLGENVDCHNSLMKRQMAESAAIGLEMSSLKKLNQNQRNEIKFYNKMTATDFKDLKDECTQTLEQVQCMSGHFAISNFGGSTVHNRQFCTLNY